MITEDIGTECIAAVEREFDSDIVTWAQRWTFPGGVYDDAPPAPKGRALSTKRVVGAVLKVLEAHGEISR